MRLRWRMPLVLAAVTLIVAPTLSRASGLRHWELNLTATDADLSPDDRLLAVTLETRSGSKDGDEQATESVEVWDYRESRKLASATLSNHPKIAHTPNIIRFTADGGLLVVSEATRLHVLDPSTLTSLRTIEPPLRQRFRIFQVETSPTGHTVVVGANVDMSGVLFAYDLDTGRMLFQSELPYGVRSIAWTQDASQVAVATPYLCTHSRETIQVFSTSPWSHLRTLSARNPTSVAFSPTRLYVAESGFCDGSLLDRHLGLEVFEVRNWHREKKLSLQHVNIHDTVSFANSRLLADTGQIRTVHDWLDGTTSGSDVNVSFTIWKDEASSIELTSPPLATRSQRALGGWRLRLSRSGKMVILNARRPQVFEIP